MKTTTAQSISNNFYADDGSLVTQPDAYLIECKAEKMVDRLDRDYMAGHMTESEYKAAIKQVDSFVDEQYKKIEGAQ